MQPPRIDAQTLSPSAAASCSPGPAAQILTPPVLLNAPITTGLPNPTVTVPPVTGPSPTPPQDTYSAPPGLPNPTVTMPSPDAAPTPASSCPTPASNLLQAIYQSAVAFSGQSTAWPGTQCDDGTLVSQPSSNPPYDWYGNCGCAAAVQHIVQMATGATIGSYSVLTWLQYAQSGSPYGGSLVPDELAQQGDIIIWFTDPSLTASAADHIGICASPQCTSTMSNSSSTATFAPSIGNIDNFGSEFPYHIIWEPAHIP